MPTFEEVIWAILAITLAAAIVMVAVAQLDSGAWAEGVRSEASAETQGVESQAVGEREGIPAPLLMIAATIGSFLKITLLLGIPGLITIGVLRLTRRNGKHAPAGAVPS